MDNWKPIERERERREIEIIFPAQSVGLALITYRRDIDREGGRERETSTYYLRTNENVHGTWIYRNSVFCVILLKINKTVRY